MFNDQLRRQQTLDGPFNLSLLIYNFPVTGFHLVPYALSPSFGMVFYEHRTEMTVLFFNKSNLRRKHASFYFTLKRGSFKSDRKLIHDIIIILDRKHTMEVSI